MQCGSAGGEPAERLPPGSQIGTGAVAADVRLQWTKPWATSDIAVFNDHAGRLVLFNRPSVGEPFVLVGVLGRSDEDRLTLSIVIPPTGIPEALPDPPYKDFHLSLGASRLVGHGKARHRITFLTNPRTCTGRTFRWKADLYYQTGEHLSSHAAAPCRLRR
jgi:hypothetical protein